MSETSKEVDLKISTRVLVHVKSEDGLIDDEVPVNELVHFYMNGLLFLSKLSSLDNPDPESKGFKIRQTITLNAIISQAKEIIGELADRYEDDNNSDGGENS